MCVINVMYMQIYGKLYLPLMHLPQSVCAAFTSLLIFELKNEKKNKKTKIFNHTLA